MRVGREPTGHEVRAARAANTAVLRPCWSIGGDILERPGAGEWGSKVVERLAADPQRETGLA